MCVPLSTGFVYQTITYIYSRNLHVCIIKVLFMEYVAGLASDDIQLYIPIQLAIIIYVNIVQNILGTMYVCAK